MATRPGYGEQTNTIQETGPALMAAAAAETARVVTGAATTAHLGQQTPCPDWDLRTLLNHTILWTAYSAERRAYGESVAEDHVPPIPRLRRRRPGARPRKHFRPRLGLVRPRPTVKAR